ncbi:MAG: methionyl-tRNA formyltransferase [Synergistota bacterium]|jgi:methionyl-tRNA formyltransferase|nr:methionyl-tRNA formyltransferase [Synergistota bacterium]
MKEQTLRQPRLWFFGTGHFASACLRHITKEINFELIVTSPPSRGGRGMKLIPTPVEEECALLGFPVLHSGRVSEEPELVERLQESPPASILVVDFGQRIREPFLSKPAWGCLNIHPSMLPAYRGAAPVQRALMNGEGSTGVTLFRLVEEMDAGPILLQEEWRIGERESAGEILEILAEKGSKLYIQGVECLREESCGFREQDSEMATYAPKIQNMEAEFFWTAPSRVIVFTVRAMNPSPGAFVAHGGRRLKIWEAVLHHSSGHPGEVLGFVDGNPIVAASEGSIVLLNVQPEGKRRTGGAEWARGNRLKRGDILK